MELLGFICTAGAFVVGWVLGYYDIPNLKLSQKDAVQDYLEDHPDQRMSRIGAAPDPYTWDPSSNRVRPVDSLTDKH